MNRLLPYILLLLPLFALASSPKVHDSVQFERIDTQPLTHTEYEPKEWVTGVHDTIPDWAVDNCPNHFVGISDPCLNQEEGETQAVNRALFMAMLSKGATVKILFEDIKKIKNVALHEYTTDKYIRVINLYTHGTRGYFEIGRTEQNIFGETFVELIEQSTPTPNSIELSSSDSFDCAIEYMSIDDEEILLDNKFTMSYVEHNGTISIDKEKGGQRTIERTIAGEEHAIIGAKHTWYSDNNSAQKVTNIHLLAGTPMCEGYWCALIESMIHGVMNETTYPFTIKSLSLGDIESTRSIYKGTISIEQIGVSIYEDLLRSQWSIEVN